MINAYKKSLVNPPIKKIQFRILKRKLKKGRSDLMKSPSNCNVINHLWIN